MHSVRYGESTISYSLVRRPRRTLGITVHPDRSVIVSAPEDAGLESIQALVLRRARWILRQQVDLARYEPRATPRQYVSGESYRYLGRQYQLKVIGNSSERVRLARPRLEVYLPGRPATATVQRLLLGWFRTRAKAVFSERWAGCLAKMERHNVPSVPFVLLAMRSRWGSCTASKRILLNPELVKAPTECIDYVMLHELCHLRYPAHDWRFYRLLSRVCPDWPRLKSRLNAVEI